MGISIQQIEIHFLDKEPKTTTASVDYSSSPVEKNDFAKNLISEVHKAINLNSNLKNATFKEDEENSFTKTLKEYISVPTHDNFNEFTHSLDLLKQKVEKEIFAKGGYYLFSDYEIDGYKYLTVILLRKKSGINIVKKDESYVLDESENLNFEKIAMGLRLNHSIYNSDSDDRNYLAIITTQQDGEVSGYFKDWVLAEGLIKNSENTDRMINIIKSIPLPVDDDGNNLFDRPDFNKAVFDHVRNRRDKRVNLFDLGAVFYGEENKNAFRDFADANNIVIDSEFKRFPPKWKSLVSIRASVPGININIDYDKFGQDGVEVKSGKVIINSEELAKSISNQYNEY